MDIQKFLNAALTPRTEEVPAPELAAWFPEGAAPVWVVRGLTAAEMGRAREAAEEGRSDNVRALVSALAGAGDKVTAIRKAFGLADEDVPADVSRRIEMLAAGTIAPALGEGGREVAVKLSETYPTLFYNLTNRIIVLTGQGSEVGKPKRSGVTPE
jgi:hypothetical protein